MLQLTYRNGEITHTLSLKLESANSFGSIKDRVAWAMLSGALENGTLRSGAKLVEVSSGNLGVAIAGFSQLLRLQAIIVSSPNIAPGNAEAIRSFGAALCFAEVQPGESACQARIHRAREIAARTGSVFLNQYEHPATYLAHETWTAPEAFSERTFDACFVCASSGGTARGFAGYLNQRAPHTQLVIVDAVGSNVVEAAIADHTPPGIPGFGSVSRSAFLPIPRPCRICRVSDRDAIDAFFLLTQKGLKIGGSSAACLLGALRWLNEQNEAQSVLCICADDNDKYAFATPQTSSAIEAAITRLRLA